MSDEKNFLKARGFVLSSMPVGENDRRIVVLTKELGKTSAFVRGGAKPKSPLLAATNPFFFGDFEFYAGTNSLTLRGAKQQARFDDILKDLDDTYMGMYFLEVSGYFGNEAVDESDRLNLLYVAIKALMAHRIDRQLIRLVFELRTMLINGVYPDVFSCHHCGKHLDVNEENLFSAADCFFYDSACRSTINGTAMTVSPYVMYALQFVMSAPVGRIFSFELKGEALEDFSYIIRRLRNRFFEHTFKTERFLT
ncbi:MAG: DNA repair protein RecO [Lachnospiraceae bacterium]|nr:DNA repair protein RecO [Lachnospiraceae bacterium]